MPELIDYEAVSYPVMEEFLTIQGEGINAGRPAYFIRLAGCDVGCHWCDVKESWNKELHPQKRVIDLIGTVESSGAKFVVITGGEPLMHDLNALTSGLKSIGCSLWIETSGAYPMSGSFDWICVSPKKFLPARPDVLKMAHELKVIVYHHSDIKWAQEMATHAGEATSLLLQPEWSRKDTVMPLIIDFVKKETIWRISLQTHKYLNIP